MTYRECAIQAWREMGWSEEKIVAGLKIRDKNAFVITDITYKNVPPEMEREIIDFFKGLENSPEELKRERIKIARQIIAEKQSETFNN